MSNRKSLISPFLSMVQNPTTPSPVLNWEEGYTLLPWAPHPSTCIAHWERRGENYILA